MVKRRLALLLITLFCCTPPLLGQTLQGSRASVDRQHQEAINQNFSFLKTPQEVRNFVQLGYLVSVEERGLLELHDVSFPYARPAVKLFLQRLAAQYRNACGEILTVTSLTRPLNKQPRNASQASVHPTGMAVDLRIPRQSKCRSWLEGTLLSLEGTGVLDVTLERNPLHYHIALFTRSYETYVAGLEQGGTNQDAVASKSTQEYVVRRGDSLYAISSRTGTTIEQLRAANNLTGNMIMPGQKLAIPAIVAGNFSSNSTPSEISHNVSRGETLWKIAMRYHTTVTQLRSINGLTDDFLQIGQTLKVHMQPEHDVF